MNSKERAERILAWQLLGSKNFMMTSMAMSVALLLSACGGSSDSGSSNYSGSSDSSWGGTPGDAELDLLNYLNPDQPVSLVEGYVTFNFQYPISLSGNPQLGLQLLLDGEPLTISGDMNSGLTTGNVLGFTDFDKITYAGNKVTPIDQLPDLDDMSTVEIEQLYSTAKLELLFPESASLAIASNPQVVLKTNTLLNDDAIVALLLDALDDADDHAEVTFSSGVVDLMEHLDKENPVIDKSIGQYFNFDGPINLEGKAALIYSFDVGDVSATYSLPLDQVSESQLFLGYEFPVISIEGEDYTDLALLEYERGISGNEVLTAMDQQRGNGVSMVFYQDSSLEVYHEYATHIFSGTFNLTSSLEGFDGVVKIQHYGHSDHHHDYEDDHEDGHEDTDDHADVEHAYGTLMLSDYVNSIDYIGENNNERWLFKDNYSVDGQGDILLYRCVDGGGAHVSYVDEDIDQKDFTIDSIGSFISDDDLPSDLCNQGEKIYLEIGDDMSVTLGLGTEFEATHSYIVEVNYSEGWGGRLLSSIVV